VPLIPEFCSLQTMTSFSVVYGLSCFKLDSRFAGSNPAKDYGFLRAIKICSMINFVREVKPSFPCREILGHVKKTLRV
jgi:hypothetical protein